MADSKDENLNNDERLHHRSRDTHRRASPQRACPHGANTRAQFPRKLARGCSISTCFRALANGHKV